MNIQEKKKMKRTKILKSARDLFVEKGYDEVRIIDIAKGAGVGKGTIYEYFNGKDEIVEELLNQSFKIYKEKCDEILKEDISIEKRIRKFLYMESNITEESFINIRNIIRNSGILQSDMSTIVVDNIRTMWKYKFKFVKELVDRGLEKGELRQMDASILTLFIVSATHGFLYYKNGGFFHAKTDFNFDVENMDEDLFMEMLLNGITNQIIKSSTEIKTS